MERRDHHGSGIRKTATRFRGIKEYGTGVDPDGGFIEFLKKDVIRNIDVHRDTVQRVEDLEALKNRIPVGCTKVIREQRKPSAPAPYRITTDHISFQPPAFTSQGPPPIPQYTKANTTKEGWVAPRSQFTLSNCHSTGYNIVNFQENPHAVIRKATNLHAGRAKGITQFSDLNRPYNPNFNQEFARVLSEDPKTFYRRTGIFSHMYDAAARHGYMTMPFEKAQESNGKPAFKC
jgi:hypothetical protein